MGFLFNNKFARESIIMELSITRLFQLAKQNLIRKVKLNEYSKLFIEHIALHSTDYLTPYLSLWARVKNFDPKLFRLPLSTYDSKVNQ